MRDHLGAMFAGLMLLAAITFVAVWSAGLNLGIKRYFGVQNANADRVIFEQSQSYREGMIRDMEHLRAEYDTATAEQRAGLKALIIERFEVFPEDYLTPSLKSFYDSLRTTP